MKHRTALISATSVVIVLFAGAVAMGANLGILNAADTSSVGTLSAASAVETGTAAAGGTGAAAAGRAAAVSQEYVVGKAGTVSVVRKAKSLRVTDVTARPGWRWSLEQNARGRLTVTFTAGDRTLVFHAKLGPNGTVVARAEKPVTRVVDSGTGSSGSSTGVAQTLAPSAASDDHADDAATYDDDHAEPSDDGESHDGGEDDD